MDIFVPSTLVADPAVMHMINMSYYRGSKVTRDFGGPTLYFNNAGMRLIDDDQWATIIGGLVPLGLRIDGALLCSPVMPLATLDETVPEGWAGSTKTIDEATEQKTWAEYLHYRETENGVVFLFNGPVTAQGNGSPQTHDQTMACIAQFGGYQSPAAWDALAPEAVEPE